MLGRPLILLCAALACPLVLADGVSSIHLAFEAPAEAIASSSRLMQGEEAAVWRRSIDADDDGFVTAEELAAWEAGFRAYLGEEWVRSSSEIVGASYALDGAAPSTRLEGFNIQGAAGDVASSAPVRMDITLVYSWNVNMTGPHTLRIEADGPGEEQAPVDQRFEIRAPPDYHIADTSGLGEPRLTAGRTIVTMTLSLQADQGFSIMFEPGQVRQMSGFGVAGALLGVLAMAGRRA